MPRWGVLAGSVWCLCASPLTTDLDAQVLDFEIIGPSFAAIQTADVEAASRWYRSTFGLTEVNRMTAEDGRYTIAILSSAGLSIELIQLRGVEAPPDRHFGWFKAGFYVNDIARAHDWLSKQGVDVDQSVFPDTALQAMTFVLRDLEGNRLQLFQRCPTQC